MAFSGSVVVAPTGSTGVMNPGQSVPMNLDDENIAFQFVVEQAGATPTVTFKIQGSLDGSNWYDIPYVTDASDTLSQASLTMTAVGTKVLFGMRPFAFYRVVVSANTNVTFRCEAYPFRA